MTTGLLRVKMLEFGFGLLRKVPKLRMSVILELFLQQNLCMEGKRYRGGEGPEARRSAATR